MGDLIQAKFQEILGDESCRSVDAGLTYYEGDGSLLKNLPTYKENKGAIWNLYEQFYALGDKRCDDFRTCGATGDTADRSTPSKANILMLGLFQQGASAIYAGDVTNARAIIK